MSEEGVKSYSLHCMGEPTVTMANQMKEVFKTKSKATQKQIGKMLDSGTNTVEIIRTLKPCK